MNFDNIAVPIDMNFLYLNHFRRSGGKEAAKKEESPDKTKVQLIYFHMYIWLLLSSPLIEEFKLLSHFSRFAQRFNPAVH